MPISLDPDHQLDLAARKLLVARLLRLARTARFERDLQNEEVDGEGVLGGGGATLLAPKFARIFDDEITECYHRDATRPGESSLIAFLQELSGKIALASAHVDVGPARAAREALDADTKLFDCGDCGRRRELVCNNGIVDSQILADPEGGLCLSFLLKLIEAFATAAERCYEDIVGARAYIGLIPPMVLETHRKNGTYGTLPIDGEFEQPVGQAKAILRIFWPIDQTLDDAIRSLPYLVFHEVFVHGPQGAALGGPRFKVDDTCAFTEGAVDAVGCDLLLDRVLTLPDALPRPLEELFIQLEEACRDYHNKRFTKEGNDPAALLAPGSKIRDARYRGRSHIYMLLKQVRTVANREQDWPARVILMLHLHLDKQQRREIFKLFHKVGPRRNARLRLADHLDQFLTTGDTVVLIDAMRSLLGVSVRAH